MHPGGLRIEKEKMNSIFVPFVIMYAILTCLDFCFSFFIYCVYGMHVEVRTALERVPSFHFYAGSKSHTQLARLLAVGT